MQVIMAGGRPVEVKDQGRLMSCPAIEHKNWRHSWRGGIKLKTFPVGVRIFCSLGSVTVKTSATIEIPEVRLCASFRSPAEELEQLARGALLMFRRSTANVQLREEWASGFHVNAARDVWLKIELVLPYHLAILHHADAKLDVETIFGGVVLKNLPIAQVEATTKFNKISVGGCGGRVNVQTQKGLVSISGCPAQARVTAKTQDGDISVSSSSAKLNLSSDRGDLFLMDVDVMDLAVAETRAGCVVVDNVTVHAGAVLIGEGARIKTKHLTMHPPCDVQFVRPGVDKKRPLRVTRYAEVQPKRRLLLKQ